MLSVIVCVCCSVWYFLSGTPVAALSGPLCCLILDLLCPAQMVGTLKALALIHAPLILMQLVTMVYRANGDMPMDLDMVEYFAGKMAVTQLVSLQDSCFGCLGLNWFSFWFPWCASLEFCNLWIKVTKCWARSGMKCCPYEILLDSSTMDILSPIGNLSFNHNTCVYTCA